MTENATPPDLIPGVTIRLGRRDYVVPPLNARGVRQVAQLVPALEGTAGDNVDYVTAAMEVLHLAMVRNYPEITKEELEDIVDLANLPRLMAAVLAPFAAAPAAIPPAAL